MVQMGNHTGDEILIWSTSDTLFIIQQTAEALIALASLLGNTLVLYVIYRYKQLRTTSNFLIASLAAADLLVGAVGIPCVIINNFTIPHHLTGCLIMSSIIIALTQVSIFGLVTIALERLMAIKAPFQHRTMLSNSLISLVILICWILGFIIGFVPVFGWHREPIQDNLCVFNLLVDMNYMIYFNCLTFVLFPLLCILAIYLHIFVLLKRKRKAVGIMVDETLRHTCHASNVHVVTHETKIAKHIFVLILVSYIAWIPIHVINMVFLFTGYLNRALTIAAILLSHLNSALNPVLYARGNHKFRETMKKTLVFKFKDRLTVP